jgi:hypothetical protein
MDLLRKLKRAKWKRFFRLKWQKITRGWDDSETWCLRAPFARFILPRLKRFKQLKAGHPYDITAEEWDIILDKMIFAFESVIKEEDSKDYNEPIEQSIERWAKIQEGFDLFGKWYLQLWW